MGVLAKLDHGVSLDRARSFMQTVARRIEETNPDSHAGVRVVIVPLRQEAVGDVRASFWILLGAVGLVLLIASANVSSVVLVRAESRAKEFAVRAAMGAGSARIARLIALEGLVFVVAGGSLGTLISLAAIDALPRLTPEQVPRLEQSVLDGRALAATLAVCAISSLLCALLPAIRASRSKRV